MHIDFVRKKIMKYCTIMFLAARVHFISIPTKMDLSKLVLDNIEELHEDIDSDALHLAVLIVTLRRCLLQ